jgi:hypothetical protein
VEGSAKDTQVHRFEEHQQREKEKQKRVAALFF